jgi:hypothetical protein
MTERLPFNRLANVSKLLRSKIDRTPPEETIMLSSRISLLFELGQTQAARRQT